MAHAIALKPYKHTSPGTSSIPLRSKILYIAIVGVLLALAIAAFVSVSIMNSVNNEETTVQQHTNTTNPGATEDTGAPTESSGTPTDRVNPAPSGSGGNTLLNPEQ